MFCELFSVLFHLKVVCTNRTHCTIDCNINFVFLLVSFCSCTNVCVCVCLVFAAQWNACRVLDKNSVCTNDNKLFGKKNERVCLSLLGGQFCSMSQEWRFNTPLRSLFYSRDVHNRKKKRKKKKINIFKVKSVNNHS